MLGNLFKALIKTAVGLPVAIVKDVFTLGNFGEKPYSAKKVEEIADELDEAL